MFFPLSRAFLVAILNDTRQKIIEAKFPVKQKVMKYIFQTNLGFITWSFEQVQAQIVL